jgi:hypothetical protein
MTIAGTGGGGATGVDGLVVDGTVAAPNVSLRCVEAAVEEAARASDAGVVSVEFWPQLPTMPKRARTPTTPIASFPLVGVRFGVPG